MSTKKKFQVGERVEARESGKRGVVVYVFGDFTLKDVVVVKFDKQSHAVAMSVADLKKPKTGERR